MIGISLLLMVACEGRRPFPRLISFDWTKCCVNVEELPDSLSSLLLSCLALSFLVLCGCEFENVFVVVQCLSVNE